MRWLCIEAHFLGGRYHGLADDGQIAQWPPNPHRLLQALIAAATLGFRRTEFSDAKKEALRWLEVRPAPEIEAPIAEKAPPVQLYVPNNDMDSVASAWAKNALPKKKPSELRTSKALRSHRVDGAPVTVRFLWPIDDGEWEAARRHAEALCGEARHLHALGLGIDLVAGDGRILDDGEKRRLSGELWIADERGSGWRVPVAGSVDEALTRYAGQRVRVRSGRGTNRFVRTSGRPTAYREVLYRRRNQGEARTVYAFALRSADSDDDNARSFDPRDAMEVAAWLRHAAHLRARGMKLAQDFVEHFVCGHGGDQASKAHRFSYVPIPTISPKGRDGRIRRVLVVEPAVGGGRAAEAVARRLAGADLVSEETGEVMAALRAIERAPSDPVLTRYLRRSRRWGTATPIVLPGHDDRKAHKAQRLMLKALVQSGCTTPIVEIHLQAEPVFPGAEMTHRYRVPLYLQKLSRTHAIITFAEDVPGPMIVGAGRHIGLGVMAAMDEHPSPRGSPTSP